MTSSTSHRFASLCLTGLAVAVVFAATMPARAYRDDDILGEEYTVQALLGAAKFENLSFDVEDSEEHKEVDLTLMPQLGGAWGTLPKGGWFQYGLECSFLLGFRFDKVNYLVIGSSGLHASISVSMWMFDLAGGPYVSLFPDPGKRVRIYAGAGPLMSYADYRANREYSDGTTADEEDRESAFGVGVYARTGIEARVREKAMLGLGARGTWSNVDFSDVGGRSELAGVAVFATYVVGF